MWQIINGMKRTSHSVYFELDGYRTVLCYYKATILGTDLEQMLQICYQ